MYPVLNWYEELPSRDNINKIYTDIYGERFNNTFIRWPKIGIIMDDSSGSSLLTNTTENKLFMFL